MSREPNVFEPEWDREVSEGPLRGRGCQVGRHAGAVELGATLYELEPEAMSPLYHAHHANEELLIVLSGEPELRAPASRRKLDPGTVVAFLRGDEGAHTIYNRAREPARVLIISTMRYPDIVEHPDTGTTMAILRPGEGKVFPDGTDIPSIDALRRAAGADPEFGAVPRSG
jgi:uncharacterized cupin superfamily protein